MESGAVIRGRVLRVNESRQPHVLYWLTSESVYLRYLHLNLRYKRIQVTFCFDPFLYVGFS